MILAWLAEKNGSDEEISDPERLFRQAAEAGAAWGPAHKAEADQYANNLQAVSKWAAVSVVEPSLMAVF